MVKIWEWAKKEPLLSVIILLVIILFLYLLFFGLILGYSEWHVATGFEGRTLWSWLKLIGFPLVIGIVGWRFSIEQKRRELAITEEERKNALSLERQKNKNTVSQMQFTVLDKSIDAVVSILFGPQALTPNTEEFTKTIRAKVISAIMVMDCIRNGIFLDFLQSLHIDLDLSLSKLSEIKLSYCNITNINFSNTFLRKLNFRRANINNTIFFGSTLLSVDFFEATGEVIDFSNTKMTDVEFSYIKFKHANFSGSDICGGSFLRAEIVDSTFLGATFDSESPPDFSEAIIRNTIMPSGDTRNDD